MNTLLLFFALPVATILLAIVLQRILKCPILVAITFFAIYLIVTFAAFDATFLVFAILYSILAYITALIVKFICKILRRIGNNNCGCVCGNNDNECCNNSNTETEVVSATCRVTEEDINDIANQTARQTTCALLNAINNNSNNNNNNSNNNSNNNNSCCNRRI